MVLNVYFAHNHDTRGHRFSHTTQQFFKVIFHIKIVPQCVAKITGDAFLHSWTDKKISCRTNNASIQEKRKRKLKIVKVLHLRVKKLHSKRLIQFWILN